VIFPTSRRRPREGTSADRGKLLAWRAALSSPVPPSSLWARLRRTGPGIVTGAADVDPSLVLTATVVGAAYGYSLLWVVLLCVPFLISVFGVAARIGHETRRGLVDLLRDNYGSALAVGCAGLIIVINMAMIVADLMAVTDGLALILDQRRIFFVAAIAFSVWYVLIFRDFHKINRALVWLSLPLFAYVAAAVLAAPAPREVLLHTFLPRMTRDSGYGTAIVALFGSLLTPYVIVWQTSSRGEHAALGGHAPGALEHHAGTFVTSLISYSVVVAAAAVLNPVGRTLPVGQISSMSFVQAAQALSPIGEIGPLLFAIGIIGAGMVALPVLVASMCYVISEAAGWPRGLSENPWEAKRFYVLISAALFVGAAANFFHLNPVRALYWSQILAGALTVPILVLILMLSNDRRVMHTTNTTAQNFWLGAAVGGLIAAGATILIWNLSR